MTAALSRVKSDLPLKLANLGQNFFSRSFQASQWDGIKWPDRKNTNRKQKGKHLLVQTGKLRASVYHSIRQYNFNEIIWGIDVPYAKYQNEGTDTIPQRKFMGDSPELRKKLHDKIRREMFSVFTKR